MHRSLRTDACNVWRCTGSMINPTEALLFALLFSRVDCQHDDDDHATTTESSAPQTRSGDVALTVRGARAVAMLRATHIQTVCRVRPLLPCEADRGATDAITFPAPNQVRFASSKAQVDQGSSGGAEHCFSFDAVLGPTSTQADVFAHVSPLVDCVTDDEGTNACVMLYGQCGAGKGHTQNGIIGLAIERILARSAQRDKWRQTTEGDNDPYSPSPTAQGGTPVFISVFDLYNGNVRDMLGDGSTTRKASVKVRCDDSKEVYVENVSEHKVHSASHAEELVGNANAAAYHAATSMGDIRSRAHVVIRIRVGGAEAENVADLEGTSASSKLLFVRLCGSETVPSNFNPSAGSTINMGLRALGTVFKKLLEARSGGGQAESMHIPYRATLLTLLLRDTLENRGPFLLVSCLSPADTQETNTIHTMKFAQVACNIKLNGKKRAKRPE